MTLLKLFVSQSSVVTTNFQNSVPACKVQAEYSQNSLSLTSTRAYLAPAANEITVEMLARQFSSSSILLASGDVRNIIALHCVVQLLMYLSTSLCSYCLEKHLLTNTAPLLS